MIEIDAARVLADLRELAVLSGGRFAGARRLAWTEEWRASREWLRAKLAELELVVDVDPAGNLWARHDRCDGPFLVIGSHLDAVPAGGWLDGALGVLAAVGAMRALRGRGDEKPVAMKLVDWADEEGARFGRSLLGSSACAGTLVPNEVRDLTDADGTRLQDALQACGVDLDAAPGAAERLRGAAAYVELHIEQGPVLLKTDRLVAAVSGTFGVERHIVSFRGETAHAGATPMSLRRDALAAAAQATLEIRRIGISSGGVCTVGQMRAMPGIVTAIAGDAELHLDQRHLDGGVLAAMLGDAEQACHDAAADHGCEVTMRRIFRTAPTRFAPDLVDVACRAIESACGEKGDAIPSGPLHDATEIGRVLPTVMLFAQSDPPLSHTAVEDSSEAALRVSIAAYGATVEEILKRIVDGRLSPTVI